MYLWKVDSLVDDFKSGNVSQQEEFKYMLLFTVVIALLFDPAISSGSYSYNYYDTICSVLTLGISIFGIYSCYKINKNGDNQDFMVRIMCIGFPVMIRVLVVFIPIFFIGGILEFLLEPTLLEEEVYEISPIGVAILSVFTAAYYWYLSIKIRAVSS